MLFAGFGDGDIGDAQFLAQLHGRLLPDHLVKLFAGERWQDYLAL
jgi:hypothetical protein